MAAVTTDSILGPASLPIFLPATNAFGGRTPQKRALCLGERSLPSRPIQLNETHAGADCAVEDRKARQIEGVESAVEAATVTVTVEGLRMEGLRTEGRRGKPAR